MTAETLPEMPRKVGHASVAPRSIKIRTKAQEDPKVIKDRSLFSRAFELALPLGTLGYATHLFAKATMRSALSLVFECLVLGACIATASVAFDGKSNLKGGVYLLSGGTCVFIAQAMMRTKFPVEPPLSIELSLCTLALSFGCMGAAKIFHSSKQTKTAD